MDEVEKPHAVCLPVPAQGHIHAMLKLAKQLHLKGFHITFVHTESNYNTILASGGPSAVKGLDDFRFETIPDGLQIQDMASLSTAIREHMAAPFRSLLKRLNEPSSGVPKVTCIISDNFTSFTLDVAAELGIPAVLFSSISAAAYMGCILFKDIIDKGLVPLKSESDLSNGYLDALVDWVPGMKNIRLKDLPSFIWTTEPNGILVTHIKDEAQAAYRASAIIINTFDDLERPLLHAMSSVFPPMYTVGPLTLLNRHVHDEVSKTIGSNNLWTEDSSCLKWLDGKEPGSVVYLNFGSLTVLTNQQLIEFAWGLSSSGHDFLWVIRPDMVMGDSAILTKEFLAEIKERGLLVSWCPQEEVLMHPSIGGFLTHCGWNSMMESISAGVPMICWPYFGDQLTNCRYACNEWGIGMEIDNNVKREEVEGLIRELMNGDIGKAKREQALKWKESALRATDNHGKSFLNLDKVINEVLLKMVESK